MSDDNKEGAGVPVAWLHYAAKKPKLRRVDFSPTPSTLEKASGWLSIALGPVATPPAVMPAAPSDAVRPCEYCDDTGDVHGLDGEWRGVCICPAGAALAKPVQEVATTHAIPKGDLSKVWQAADDVCEWLNYEVSEKSPGLLKSIEILNEAMGRAEIRAGRAEPAAGEQAGAVALPITAAIWVDDGGERPAYCLMAAYASERDANTAMQLLAAPGAAIAAREQEPRGKRSLAGFMYRHAVDIASREKHANGWVRGPWQLTFDIEGAKRHPHSGVWPGFEFYPLYRDLSDEVRTDTALASREEAPATPQGEMAAPSDEDMVNAAYRLHKYRQGTDNGIAFNRGARWMRAALTQPTTVQQVLSDERIKELWVEHGLDECDPEGFARIIEAEVRKTAPTAAPGDAG